MTKNQQLHKKLLPHLFRQEYAKMTAVLCRHFGLMHITTHLGTVYHKQI